MHDGDSSSRLRVEGYRNGSDGNYAGSWSKTVALADEAARNLGCTSAKAFFKYNKKYVAGAIGIGALAWLLLKHKK